MTEHDDPASDDPRAVLRPQGADECAAAAMRLVQSARERVRIVAQRADLRYLATTGVIDALRTLLLQSRRARLEILLAPDVARDDLGRPLWNLAQRLTSFVTVHRLGDEDVQLGEAWLTADERGYLHRPQVERLEALACLEQPPRARELNQRFASLWLASEPDPDLRRLGA
jgi:hypothetical protein